MTFNDLGLIEPILGALETEGYKTPTPIQQQAIPIVLQQRDVLGCAQTGTGKTAAFAIPILQLLTQVHAERVHHRIKVLVLTPTRELAIQIADSFAAYGRNLKLRSMVIFGGVSQVPQVQELKRGVDILIATPGRLLDLMQQGYISISDLSIFVLDEADRMLDMGFIHDVKKVIAKLPAQRQTLFFSATMPPEIQNLANTILTRPERIEVTPVSSTAETITQSVYFVDKPNKRHLLKHVLQDESITRVLVFTRTKHGADRVARDLTRSGIKAEAIHGDKSQNARQRALGNFKDHKIRALIATDIAARGIDVDDLTHVINFEIPEVPETYVHRIGRTGRAGASGTAISFCDAEERADLKNIIKLIGRQIPVVEEHPFPLGSAQVPETPPQPVQQQRGRNNGHQKGAQQHKKQQHKDRNNGQGDARPQAEKQQQQKPAAQSQQAPDARPAQQSVHTAQQQAKRHNNETRKEQHQQKRHNRHHAEKTEQQPVKSTPPQERKDNTPKKAESPQRPFRLDLDDVDLSW